MSANIGTKVEVSWSSGSYEINGEPYRRNSSVMKAIPKPALDNWKYSQVRQATINTVLENLEQIKSIQDSAKDKVSCNKAIYQFVLNMNKGDSQALKFGSEVHLMIEDAVQGIKRDYEFEITSGHRNAANSAFSWLRSKGKPIEPGPIVEMVVFNPEYRIAGRLDYWHGTGTFCADWKTGKALYADYAIQLTLYTKIMTRAIIPQSNISNTGYVGTVIPWNQETAGEAYLIHLRKKSDPIAKLVNPKHETYIKEIIKSAITIDSWLDNTYSYRGSPPKMDALI